MTGLSCRHFHVQGDGAKCRRCWSHGGETSPGLSPADSQVLFFGCKVWHSRYSRVHQLAVFDAILIVNYYILILCGKDIKHPGYFLPVLLSQGDFASVLQKRPFALLTRIHFWSFLHSTGSTRTVVEPRRLRRLRRPLKMMAERSRFAVWLLTGAFRVGLETASQVAALAETPRWSKILDHRKSLDSLIVSLTFLACCPRLPNLSTFRV